MSIPHLVCGLVSFSTASKIVYKSYVLFLSLGSKEVQLLGKVPNIPKKIANGPINMTPSPPKKTKKVWKCP